MKIISKLLIFSILLSSFIVPGCYVGAISDNTAIEPTNSDIEFPLSVEVTTDKTYYSATDVAKVTVKITNVSDGTIKNISSISTFDNTKPTNPLSVLYVDNLTLDSQDSYTYSYYVTAKPVRLGLVQHMLLLFKLFFIGAREVPVDNFDNGRNITSENSTIRFGSYNAAEKVNVYYEYDTKIINTESSEDFAQATGNLIKQTLSSENFDVEEALKDELYSCRIIAKYNSAEDMQFNNFNPDTVVLNDSNGTAVIQFGNKKLAENCINSLKTDSSIAYVEADRVVALSMDDVTTFAGNSYTQDELYTWGKEKIGADKYVQYLESNDKFELVKVAVIDTGVDLDHEFLEGKILQGGYDFINIDNVADDDNGHGTHVAGIIAACTDGLNVKILPVKVLDETGVTYAACVANGISYAVSMGSDVINLSLGGAHSDYIDDTVQFAIDSGVVVCVAAGNGDSETGKPVNTKNVCPAHITDAITVAAIDKNDYIAPFSNYGNIDVAAPGVDITSAYKDGTYAILHGTSMATPHVSAVAAMVLLTDPTMAPSEVENTIVSACIDLGATGKDAYYGYGKIDLYSSLPDYSVTFVTNGGSGVETKIVKSGETVLLEEPTKTYTITLDANGGKIKQSHYVLNAELEGWYTDPDFKSERLVKGGSYTVNENTVLYAKWNNPPLDAINIPDKREGYTFCGWFNAGKQYTSTDVINNDITLKASWQMNNITLIFNGNGGESATTSKSIAYGNQYGTLPIPTRENAVFDGWYTAATGGDKVTSTTVMSKDNGSVNLYAHWLVKKTATISSSKANADGVKLNINWASTGLSYFTYGNPARASGNGTSFSGDGTPAQGTWSATTGLCRGAAVFEISNIDSVRSYIKNKGAALSSVTVNAVRLDDGKHGNPTACGYMYAVSNTASAYNYNTNPNGTYVDYTNSWARGSTFSSTFSSTAIMNNFMGTGASDYRSVMFYAGANKSDYVRISSISIIFTYTYWAAE